MKDLNELYAVILGVIATIYRNSVGRLFTTTTTTAPDEELVMVSEEPKPTLWESFELEAATIWSYATHQPVRFLGWVKALCLACLGAAWVGFCTPFRWTSSAFSVAFAATMDAGSAVIAHPVTGWLYRAVKFCVTALAAVFLALIGLGIAAEKEII